MLRFRISMSLDGYVAGPNQSVDHPLGVGGERLHEWVVPLKAWREMHGMAGGEEDESNAVVEEQIAGVGATIMGRKMFGGPPGPWDEASPWNGWWGPDLPFHHPVFVLTHHRRRTLTCDGDTSFRFVTEGIQTALDLARRAAGSKDVAIGGGASTARQFLVSGLVDEMEISLVPVLLGAGEPLFKDVGDLRELKLVRTVSAPGVTHYTFRRA